MSLQILEEKDKSQYQKAVESLTQSWNWGEFRKTTGVEVLRIGELNNSTLKSALQIFFHKIPHTNLTVGYLPRPKIINKEIIEYLKKLGKENKAIYIKVEPDEIQRTENPTSPLGLRGAGNSLKKSKAILPKHTIFIDLNKSEEELLKAMHEKTRYNIKVAQREGVKIEEKDDEKSLESFLKILEGTKKRQGFYSHPSSYFRKLWKILKGEKMVHLLLAAYRDEPLAGLLLLHFKDKLYYVHGGSSETHREKMPNHLL
ncbi:MAG: peptidoglycan bridge formation glycyltransferase FemA/FemB family protein, partial [bacterium]|nr:peptidoglycan bridge formation glycyltransferase FemA/FemB family protein [bacterium]